MVHLEALPERLRSNNVTPFASTGAERLSRLSGWWIKLGMAVERIVPGRPQQNGHHERFHSTLKAETARPPATDREQQQERFKRFQKQYNEDRPHEALGQRPPQTVYAPARRPYPEKLCEPDYPAYWERRRVRRDGSMKFKGEQVLARPLLQQRNMSQKRAVPRHASSRNDSCPFFDDIERSGSKPRYPLFRARRPANPHVRLLRRADPEMHTQVVDGVETRLSRDGPRLDTTVVLEHCLRTGGGAIRQPWPAAKENLDPPAVAGVIVPQQGGRLAGCARRSRTMYESLVGSGQSTAWAISSCQNNGVSDSP